MASHPPADTEEQHLSQLAAAGATGGAAGDAQAAAARQAVQRDLEQHFVSGGVQMEGDMQTSKLRPADPATAGQGGSTGGALQRELQAMSAAHEGEAAADSEPQAAGGGQMGMAAGGSFVRGHAAQEMAYASEEMDAV